MKYRANIAHVLCPLQVQGKGATWRVQACQNHITGACAVADLQHMVRHTCIVQHNE